MRNREYWGNKLKITNQEGDKTSWREECEKRREWREDIQDQFYLDLLRSTHVDVVHSNETMEEKNHDK